MLTHVDLFSGIGGFALAAEWAGFRTVVFCEKDEYCQKILKKHWPDVPIIAEIRDFKWPMANNGILQPMELSRSEQKRRDGIDNGGQITILTGGFPCQPFSVAGKRRGKEDDRYLWPEMFAVISQVRPTWVLAENVTGIINMELDKCLSDLEGEGYETGTFIIPACGVDAPHRRERVWIVAYAKTGENDRRKRGIMADKERQGRCVNPTLISSSQDEPDADKFNGHGGRSYSGKISQLKKAELSRGQNVANSSREGFQNRNAGKDKGRTHIQSTGKDSRREETIWPIEPDVGRVAHGIPSRVDRLKALGNAIVPQIAYEIIKAIRMIEEKEGKK